MKAKLGTFMEAVQKRMAEAGCSEADAVRFCVKEYGELHARMCASDEQFTTEENTGQEKPRATFMFAAQDLAGKLDCSLAEAVRLCADKYPALHEALRAGAPQQLKEIP